jgi:hypothetical protein
LAGEERLLHGLGRVPEERDLEVVDGGRAVHRDRGEGAGIHEGKERALHAGLDHVAAHHRDRRAPAGAREHPCFQELAKGRPREEVGQELAQRSDRRPGVRRGRELLHPNLRGALRDRDRPNALEVDPIVPGHFFRSKNRR